LYLPSLILSTLNYFSSSIRKDNKELFEIIEYMFTLPYRLFPHFYMIQEYLDELKFAYNNMNDTFSDNIIVVGHSLGGGLAKIFGKLIGKKSISLSGPGMNAFKSLWQYKGNNSDFDLTTVDIIPDHDPVPRIELSGGTSYRLLCLKTPGKCHDKELSLCESLVICRNPYAWDYCLNTANISHKDIQALYNSTEFN